VHINADEVRSHYNDWDFSPEGRMRQAARMRYLADGVVRAGKVAVADFVCPTEQARMEFNPDFTVWMDTIKEGRFEDTNKMFVEPPHCDYHVESWFNDTHEQLMPVIQRWMERNNV
jgi:adenylylsulfate kinase